MPISGVSVCHTANRLKDFAFRHNMKTGTYNATGQHYCGHFDPRLINLRQQLLNLDKIRIHVPQSVPVSNWVNGDLYTQTTEVFGILPVPDDVRLRCGILAFDSSNQSKTYTYLAKRQGARFAVLTIHSDAERSLFVSLIRTEPAFKEARPDWDRATHRWNEVYANGSTIYYKV